MSDQSTLTLSENKYKLKSMFENKYFLFLIGMIIGSAVFILIYGFKVVDVTNDEWLLTGGDLTQNYIGWQFFRNSAWKFPIFGLDSNIAYPNSVSIMYTDSIPLFALIFKSISFVLPTTFQYFGIYGILTFMLQGGFAILIINHFTNKSFYAIIASVFFLITTPLLQRMFNHTALASQWLILLMIYIYLENIKAKKSFRFNYIFWCVLTSISVLIHMYYVPMAFLFLLTYIAYNIMYTYNDKYLRKKEIMHSIIIFVSCVLFVLLMLFFIGAFSGNTQLSEGGLGDFSSNIGLLFNPQEGFSKYLHQLPVATSGQGEGLVYLGLGMIIMLFIALIISFIKNFSVSPKELFARNKRYIPLMAVSIIFLILAYSPTITCGTYILFTIPYPKIILSLLSVFRASGRFMWIIMYLIIIVVITLIYKKFKRKFISYLIIILCLLIQISDISPRLNRRSYYNNIIYNSTLSSDFWKEIADKYKNVYIMRNVTNKANDDFKTDFTLVQMYDLAEYAAVNDMTINDMYLARPNKEVINNEISEQYSKINENQIDNTSMYIFGKETSLFYITTKQGYIYKIDDYYVYLKNQILDIEKYDNAEEYKLDVQQEEKIINISNEQISNTNNEVSVVSYPIDIEPDTLYMVNLDLDIEKAPKSILCDLFGGSGYDDDALQCDLYSEIGNNSYSFIINSGDISTSNDQIMIRLILNGAYDMNIKNISIIKLNKE